ncbi:hypothetical protein EBU58_07625 [bacterium]|nr:hypothetical protein [bacterium]
MLEDTYTCWVEASSEGTDTVDDYWSEAESSNGTFSINVLSDGVYKVGAFLSPELREAGYLPPNKVEVDLTDSNSGIAVLALNKKSESNYISGTVLIDGNPVEDAYVFGWSDAGQSADTDTDEQGNFKLLVPKGAQWKVGADYFEVDNNGVETIYIIDEVHMLTREAFNALLKTLEEPPPHVKFVLCTTEPEKLPITILSRCQRFDFLTVEAGAIQARLAEIAAAEGVAIDPEAVRLVARRANGSMRDSQSLLEQLLGAAATADGRIGVDAVHALLGTGREEGLAELVQAIAGQQPKAAVESLDAAVSGGADAGGVLEQLLAVLRDALLASVAAEPRLWSADGGCGLDVQAVASTLGADTILAMMQVIDHALARMRTAGHGRAAASPRCQYATAGSLAAGRGNRRGDGCGVYQRGDGCSLV